VSNYEEDHDSPAHGVIEGSGQALAFAEELAHHSELPRATKVLKFGAYFAHGLLLAYDVKELIREPGTETAVELGSDALDVFATIGAAAPGPGPAFIVKSDYFILHYIFYDAIVGGYAADALRTYQRVQAQFPGLPADQQARLAEGAQDVQEALDEGSW
jgi:hypothetical protein